MEIRHSTMEPSQSRISGWTARYLGSYGIRMGAMHFGGIQLELIQPMENMSLFRQYLDQHGPGAQHLAMERTESFEMTLGRMAAAGNPIGSLAKVDRQEDCAFVRHTEPLGIALELYHRAGGLYPSGWSSPHGISGPAASPDPLVENMTEVTFAVKELSPGSGPAGGEIRYRPLGV